MRRRFAMVGILIDKDFPTGDHINIGDLKADDRTGVYTLEIWFRENIFRHYRMEVDFNQKTISLYHGGKNLIKTDSTAFFRDYLTTIHRGGESPSEGIKRGKYRKLSNEAKDVIRKKFNPELKVTRNMADFNEEYGMDLNYNQYYPLIKDLITEEHRQKQQRKPKEPKHQYDVGLIRSTYNRELTLTENYRLNKPKFKCSMSYYRKQVLDMVESRSARGRKPNSVKYATDAASERSEQPY